MKQVTRWEAFDGVPFPTESECRAYEKKCAHIRLVGLSIEQVEAALSRADLELADAIEVVGSRISRARLDAGERKYGRRDAPPDPTPPNGSASSETMTRPSSAFGDGSSQSRLDVHEDEGGTSGFSTQNEAV